MLNKVIEVNSILVGLFGVGIFGLITKLSQKAIKRSKAVNQRLSNLEDSNIALLHDKIYKYCSEFIESGKVSIDDLNNLEYLFKSYKSLGGNGTGETLYNRVKELPIKN